MYFFMRHKNLEPMIDQQAEAHNEGRVERPQHGLRWKRSSLDSTCFLHVLYKVHQYRGIYPFHICHKLQLERTQYIVAFRKEATIRPRLGIHRLATPPDCVSAHCFRHRASSFLRWWRISRSFPILGEDTTFWRMGRWSTPVVYF